MGIFESIYIGFIYWYKHLWHCLEEHTRASHDMSMSCFQMMGNQYFEAKNMGTIMETVAKKITWWARYPKCMVWSRRAFWLDCLSEFWADPSSIVTLLKYILTRVLEACFICIHDILFITHQIKVYNCKFGNLTWVWIHFHFNSQGS